MEDTDRVAFWQGVVVRGRGRRDLLEVSFVRSPVLWSGSRVGTFPAPVGSALFCFDCVALRVTVSIRDGPSVNAELGTWEPGPLARFAECDPSNKRDLNTNGDTAMYQNKVTLIGFLGNNAEVRTNDDRSLTKLSLATKSSYRKDGQYIEHTEWHTCIAFGKLGEFAKTLKKGAHLQVEGELRSREYDSKKTNSKQIVWEIRVDSILKLDRAAKAGVEDDAHTATTPARLTA